MKDKVKFVEEYLQWVNDNRLDPPAFTAEDYAQHLKNISNQELIDAIVEVVKTQKDPIEIVDSIFTILKDYE